MGSSASIPYDEETLKRLRGVVTMKYPNTQPDPPIPMTYGVQMTFECVTEEQVVNVPLTHISMVYGRGHEDQSFHRRQPPLSNPNTFEGDMEIQKREKTLEDAIQAECKINDMDKDKVSFLSEMPSIHPTLTSRRERDRLLATKGDKRSAVERTGAAVEAKRRQQELQAKGKAAAPKEPDAPREFPQDSPTEEVSNTEEQSQSGTEAKTKDNETRNAVDKATKRKKKKEKEEQELQERRKEIGRQRTNERLLHIINDF